MIDCVLVEMHVFLKYLLLRGMRDPKLLQCSSNGCFGTLVRSYGLTVILGNFFMGYSFSVDTKNVFVV